MTHSWCLPQFIEGGTQPVRTLDAPQCLDGVLVLLADSVTDQANVIMCPFPPHLQRIAKADDTSKTYFCPLHTGVSPSPASHRLPGSGLNTRPDTTTFIGHLVCSVPEPIRRTAFACDAVQ